jgi:hypothetical protein
LKLTITALPVPKRDFMDYPIYKIEVESGYSGDAETTLPGIMRMVNQEITERLASINPQRELTIELLSVDK